MRRTIQLLAFILALTALIAAPLPLEAQRKGLISSRACPYSCATEGIKKSTCRDWRDGNICYIEDLRSPPAATPPIPAPKVPTQIGTAIPSECNALANSGRIARPRVDIFEVKDRGNMFDSKYKVYGAVEGICLVEAGYFERGRKIEAIPIVTKSQFGRYEFKVDIRDDKGPEIRVYNSVGDYDIYEIDPSERSSRGGMGY